MTGTSGARAWGVAGLGRAFTLMLPTLQADPRVRLCAGADPREAARARFASELGARAYPTVEAMCGDPDVDVVYVASPHALHVEHVLTAARHGKHVLVEKPMALSVADCTRMIDATAAARVQLVVGHSHGFDAPIARTRALIGTDAVGDVRMIHAVYYTDFLYRPRRPEELDTARGGGAVWNQAAHQVDIVRLLAGGIVTGVRAITGNWDAARPTEGAYSALLTFAGGAFASLTYNGYGFFDGDELANWTSELGTPKPRDRHGAARRALAAVGPAREVALKNARNYGGDAYGATEPGARTHEHFGMMLVSCQRADLRPLPDGVMIYDDAGARLDPLDAPTIPRVEVIDEIDGAIATGEPALHDGRWARGTLEVCAAMLEAAQTGREVALSHQVAADVARR